MFWRHGVQIKMRVGGIIEGSDLYMVWIGGKTPLLSWVWEVISVALFFQDTYRYISTHGRNRTHEIVTTRRKGRSHWVRPGIREGRRSTGPVGGMRRFSLYMLSRNGYLGRVVRSAINGLKLAEVGFAERVQLVSCNPDGFHLLSRLHRLGVNLLVGDSPVGDESSGPYPVSQVTEPTRENQVRQATYIC